MKASDRTPGDSKIRKIIAKFQKLEQRHISLLTEWENSPEPLLLHRPTEGAWNLLQVGQHLYLSEKLTLQYMEKKLLGYSLALQVDFLTHVKFRLFLMGLVLPIRTKIPSKAVAPQPEMDLKTLKSLWQELDRKFDRFLKKLKPAHSTFPIYKHPLVGRINIGETMDFLNGHFTHHMWQVRRIRKNFDHTNS